MIAGTLVVNANADSHEVVAGGGVMPVTASVWLVVAFLFIVPFGGILAVIVLPTYDDYIVRVKVEEALTATSALKSEIQQAYAQKQPFKTGSIQVASPDVKSVDVNSSGVIVITLLPNVADGGRIVYTPSIDSAGTMSWQCSSEGMPPKYLPAACRQ